MTKQSIILLLCLGFFVFLSCKTHFKTTTMEFKAVEKDNSLEHGKNMVFNICGQCHYNHEARSFIGTRMEDLPKFMGKVYSANLTHAGIVSRYSDAELVYLLKTGIAKNGRFIPYMVRPNLSDEDLNDIVYYIRSNDDAVKANNTIVGITHLSTLGKLASSVGGKPLPYKPGLKTPSDEIDKGRYLVDNLGCFHCHSKSIIKLNYLEPEKSKGYMAGGMKFKANGKKIYAANLTPDKATGIGNYTQEDFRMAVIDGMAPGNRALQFPMRKFKHMTPKQADAIYAYLKTLMPKDHKIKH